MTFIFLYLLSISRIYSGHAAQYNIREKIASVDDPNFGNLIEHAISIIESESSKEDAMKLTRILEAKASGTLNKISMALAFTNCKKSLNFSDRENCTVVKDMGTIVCNAQIYEKKIDKNVNITYSCNGRSSRESVSEKSKSITANPSDPQIRNILHKALKSAEIQFKRKYNLKVVDIKSISSELAAGLLTKVAFTVGYMGCRKGTLRDRSTCKLLQNEPLRQCEVHAWNSSRLEGERQINVKCETDKQLDTENNEISALRRKRSISNLGGETQQDPNNPKYQAMARDVAHHRLKFKKKDVRTIAVLSVTTQVVEGVVTKIKFRVLFVKGKSVVCTAQIWEPPWLFDRRISANCGNIREHNSKTNRNKKLSHRKQKLYDIKYKKLAKQSVTDHLEKLLGKRNKNIDIQVKNIAYVTTQVSQQDIIYINLDVVTNNSSNLNCSILFGLPGDLQPISTDCIEDHRVLGGEEWADPSLKKYAILAEKLLRKKTYSDSEKAAKVHDTIVTFVVQQVMQGVDIKIDFIVRPVYGHEYKCHSRIWENVEGEDLVKNLHCRLIE